MRVQWPDTTQDAIDFVAAQLICFIPATTILAIAPCDKGLTPDFVHKEICVGAAIYMVKRNPPCALCWCLYSAFAAQRGCCRVLVSHPAPASVSCTVIPAQVLEMSGRVLRNPSSSPEDHCFHPPLLAHGPGWPGADCHSTIWSVLMVCVCHVIMN